MTQREIPPNMSPAVVATIDARLAAVRRDHGVVMPLAIESGSRAWGFPSPDSDYDCRFIYVRPVDQYLSPWQPRDVIETPMDGILDVNGWDLGKALKLLLKGNAVIIEWLMSPITCGADLGFRAAFLALARQLARRDLVGRHYLHLGQRQRRVHFGEGGSVPQKKIFYALRPAAALRWLRLHVDATVAPMHFPTLIAQCEPPAEVTDIITELITRKAVTRELGTEPLPPAINAFLDSEFALASSVFPIRPALIAEAEREATEDFFRTWVRRFDPA
ncbi:nucleotidyltransferase domain-containing protein [Oleomonas cavernae]|uniref:Nucleotidyltransferase domain-containing protein n=1 Tax=Oleomonas cavernae TaxID=2320859 RepID=A0A418WIR3_9PROT|nr:nucleotidyltransferase domain-containing protein [Oleomonas cavernae]RJF89842.1 nucleotidyltransferase domain-containing protein [Oleomonas cavernae]